MQRFKINYLQAATGASFLSVFGLLLLILGLVPSPTKMELVITGAIIFGLMWCLCIVLGLIIYLRRESYLKSKSKQARKLLKRGLATLIVLPIVSWLFFASSYRWENGTGTKPIRKLRDQNL